VEVDETVLKICLDEVFSNALKYRKKRSALTVRAGHAQGSLRVEVSNLNPPGKPLLTPEECKRVLQPGYKAHACSAMSDGLGLDSASKAVGAAGGTVALTQEPTTTTLHLCLPAVMRTGGYLSEDSTATPPAESSRSPIAAGGAHSPEQLSRSVTEPIFSQAKDETRHPPTCVGLSNDSAAAGWVHRLFGLIGAGDAAVLDSASGEDDFLDAVMGHQTGGGEAVHPAHVAVLQASWLAAAAMADRLRALGFVGVVCVHMLRASVDELAWARTHPAVDVVLHGCEEEELTRGAHGILALLRHAHRQRGSHNDTEGGAGTGGSGSSKASPVPRGTSGSRIRLAAAPAIAPTISAPTCGETAAEETAGVPAATPTAPVSNPTAPPGPNAHPPVPAPAAPPAPPKAPLCGLRAFGLDDEMIPRRILGLFMEHHLRADMGASATFGRTEEEIGSFVEVAMGLLHPDLTPNTGPATHADVVLLDENISPPKILGSLLAAELRERGFTGAVVILTGASASHISLLSALPGVDLVFDKGASLPKMGEEVRRILRQKSSKLLQPC
jgi:hypothetical protein